MDVAGPELLLRTLGVRFAVAGPDLLRCTVPFAVARPGLLRCTVPFAVARLDLLLGSFSFRIVFTFFVRANLLLRDGTFQ